MAVVDADTFLLEARLLARRTPDERWRDLGTQRFYRARVDGQQVDSISDDTYETGNVGLFAWSGGELNSTNVSFDDFVVTKLE